MNPSTFRRGGVPVLIAATTVLALLGVPPSSAVAAPAAPAEPAGTVQAVTARLAGQLAVSLRDSGQRDRVVAAAAAGPVDLATVRLGASFAASVRAANAAVHAAKGLPGDVSLLQVRLAHPDMLPALRRGAVPVVAATPTDDAPANLIGYDPAGRTVHIAAAHVPQRPVLLVEVDTAKAMALGIEVVRQRLGGAGTDAVAAATGYWATKVTAIRLSNDQEPWFKGGAEIYSIVGGFGLDGAAKVDIVQMPYLDNDGTTYTPNQLLVHFNGYKYNLADVVMMEDDGDTNYQQLAQAIATALLTIVDGGAYAPLVDAILAALPSSWYTDDPDYVDSWYTLSTASSGRLTGAAGNGWMDVTPYFVQPL
ncbi:DUF3103 family protein [Dactylosporangium sp. CA-152071]|uniref:DUF3103 family protein n=1 Tax=Dactylosporangium sp. CA-152071 TaxID=3239933 RepID=UPI003D92CC50